jgi:uncharacterized protein YaaR (DUF327 family)
MAQSTLEILVEQLDEKVQQLQEHVSNGNISQFEEYKRTCGEIKGLLIARGYILDLQSRIESSDE